MNGFSWAWEELAGFLVISQIVPSRFTASQHSKPLAAQGAHVEEYVRQHVGPADISTWILQYAARKVAATDNSNGIFS